MELTGKCIKVTDGEKFISKKTGEEDYKYYFALECTNNNFTHKVAFIVFGKPKFEAMGLVVGGTYNVSFDVASREWNNKWFTDLQAWRVTRIDAKTSQPTPKPVQQPTPQPQQSPIGNVAVQDEIPF